MNFPRDLLAKAFPGQRRLIAAFEAQDEQVVSHAGEIQEAVTVATSAGETAATALEAAQASQPANDNLTAISELPIDPGVVEQTGVGTWAIRPIDTEDTAALISRGLADTRYGSANLVGLTDGDKGDVVVSGTGLVWTFDSSVVTAYSRSLLASATAAAWKTLLALVKGDVGLGNVDNTADAAKNVLSATKLTTARTINGTSFDGTANITINAVDSTARVPETRTISTTAPLTGGGDLSAHRTFAITTSALTRTDDTNVTLTLGGTPASALLAAVSLTLGWTGQLSAGRGGTGIGSYAIGDILYASASGTLSKLAGVATGNVLISGGVTTAPSWGKVGLTTHVTGTLPVTSGGTGATASTGSGNVVLAGSPVISTPTLGNPTITGATTAGSITSSGVVDSSGLRATGASIPATGVGVEVIYTGGVGYVSSYNRGTTTLMPLNLNSSTLTIMTALGNYANDAAAATGGVAVGGVYRNGSILMIRVT